MKIIFGWYLDGPTCLETPDGGAFSIDTAVVGPLGLLNLLESRLGLSGPGVPAALRIAQYLSRLRAIDDGEMFFSASLAADGWATARLLLSWRDELVAGNWTPGSVSWESERLSCIALAEVQEERPLALGIPDRVRATVPRIRNASPIDDLILVDDPQRLPLVWRHLIEALDSTGTTIARATVEPGKQASDLGAVQGLLSSRKQGEVTGDQTFSVLQCDDELVAGDIAAEWLAASPAANGDVVVIRQGNATILDAACHRLGLPKPGGGERSPYRGALQVLPLAFETSWQPLDAGRILELLVMRGSPVPYRIGRYFANVLRDFPGTGGTYWLAAWEKAAELLREEHSGGNVDEAELANIVQKSLADSREWLDPERFDRESGVPPEAADAICRKVQRWAIRRASANGNAIYIQTATAAAALADTIAASGVDPISKPQLDRMIDAVIAEGIERPDTIAEAASWTTVDDPAQIWSSVPSVLWWGFSDPGTVAPRQPWTDAEQAELTAAGIRILPCDEAIARHLEAQRRGILCATDRVLLVMSALAAAENTATHPVWHEIANVEGLDRTIIVGRSLRRASMTSLCGRAWQPAQIENRKLPHSIRDWTVPKNLIGARETESATSLESLLGCPLNWVLQYHARLRESSLLDMADDNRLKGNVAHEVLTRFFAGPLSGNETEIRSTVEALLDEMLPEIGSPLLLSGRLRDREDVRRNTIESAVALSRILGLCSLSVAATERKVDIPLDGQTALTGAIDLELITDDGRLATVDLKWSNSDRYRREEISEGRPVQLATYARLLKGDRSNSFPPAAYFMMKQRRLLAVDTEPFPPQFWISGSDLETVWDAIVEVRERTLGDLSGGRVVATGIETEEPTAIEDPIVVEPPCRFCPYGRLCGERALS